MAINCSLFALFLLALWRAQFSVGNRIGFEEQVFSSYRLPDHLKPIQYDLNLQLSSSEVNFWGELTIDFEVLYSIDAACSSRDELTIFSCLRGPKQTDEGFSMNQVYLHADASIFFDDVKFYDLGSQNVDLNKVKGREVKIRKFSRDHTKQMIALTLAHDLKPGKRGRIWFNFVSSYQRDKTMGVYRAESSGTSYTIGSFEPTGARLAFPCFDEPRFRVKIRLSIAHNFLTKVVSNFAQSGREELGRGRVRTRFVEPDWTLPLHKLTFVLGNLEEISAKFAEVTVSIWAHPLLVEQGEHALKVATSALKIMANSYDERLDSKRLYLVAVSKHQNEQMAGYGMSLVRQDLLLLDLEDEPIKAVQIAAQVVKVVARQWFGNQISVDKWDNLWLVEGLAANLAAYLAHEVGSDVPTARFEPYLKQCSRFKAMHDDLDDISLPQFTLQVPDTHPLRKSKDIVRYVNRRPQFFAKVAAYIKMVERLIGERDYNIVMSSILRDIRNKIIEMKSFTSTLNTYALRKMQLFQKLNRWRTNVGFPLIKLDLYEFERKVVVKQAPFGDTDSTLQWPLDLVLSFVIQGDVQNTVEVRGEDATVELPEWFSSSDPQHWLKLDLNRNEAAYYRVHYSSNLLKKLIGAMACRYMEVEDRIQLLEDAHELTGRNLITRNQFEEMLVKFYSSSSHKFQPEEMLHLLEIGRQYPIDFNEEPFIGALVAFADIFNFEPTDDTVTPIMMHAHMRVLNKLVLLGEQTVVRDLLGRFDGKLVLHVFEREPVYKAVATYGEQSQVDQMLERLKRARSRSEQIRLAKALALSQHEPTLVALYHWLVSNDLGSETFWDVIHDFRSHTVGRMLEPLLRARHLRDLNQ